MFHESTFRQYQYHSLLAQLLVTSNMSQCCIFFICTYFTGDLFKYYYLFSIYLHFFFINIDIFLFVFTFSFSSKLEYICIPICQRHGNCLNLYLNYSNKIKPTIWILQLWDNWWHVQKVFLLYLLNIYKSGCRLRVQ